MPMSKGIYAYFDKQMNEIVYVGKDSRIDINKRHKAHHRPTEYDSQQINRVVQNNPKRYIYKRIYVCPPHLDEVDLNGLEMQYIQALKPKFNFTDGGEGMKGYKHSLEARRKISEAKKENNPSHDLNNLIKISKAKDNKSGYFRVQKNKSPNCKQGFIWRYCYRDKGKRKSINSLHLDDLKKKVLEHGLPWIEI